MKASVKFIFKIQQEKLIQHPGRYFINIDILIYFELIKQFEIKLHTILIPKTGWTEIMSI